MPQPIDFQSELGRVTAAERVQQVMDRLSLVAQHRTTEEIEQQRVAHENEVQQAREQSDQIEPENRRRNPFMGRRRRHEGEPEAQQDKSQTPANPEEPHQLDVTI